MGLFQMTAGAVMFVVLIISSLAVDQKVSSPADKGQLNVDPPVDSQTSFQDPEDLKLAQKFHFKTLI